MPSNRGDKNKSDLLSYKTVIRIWFDVWCWILDKPTVTKKALIQQQNRQNTKDECKFQFQVGQLSPHSTREEGTANLFFSVVGNGQIWNLPSLSMPGNQMLALKDNILLWISKNYGISVLPGARERPGSRLSLRKSINPL